MSGAGSVASATEGGIGPSSSSASAGTTAFTESVPTAWEHSRVEAVLFCGIQGSGKTRFYREHFFESHVRISMDMLRTRNRQRVLRAACLETLQPFVLDNTNASRAEREGTIAPALASRFRVVGYYFDVSTTEALARNEQRSEGRRVPISGLLGTWKRLEVPTLEEGFAELFRVRPHPHERWLVEPMPFE